MHEYSMWEAIIYSPCVYLMWDNIYYPAKFKWAMLVKTILTSPNLGNLPLLVCYTADCGTNKITLDQALKKP